MRLELKEGGHLKFWEITLDGKQVTTRWGPIGAAGQSKVEELASLTAARAAYEQQLAEKLRKGYLLAPGQAPVTPLGKVDPRLEQAVALNPDDERAYLVLADALSEAGDPRGELISVQHALSRSRADPRLIAREKKLLSAFGLPDPDRVTLQWRWGFVQAAHFHNTRDWMDPDFDAVALARAVFAMPMSAVLEELQLGVLRWEFQEEDVPALLKEAARQGWAPRLQRLRLGHLPEDDIDLAHHPIGDVSIVSQAFPALRSLFLHAGEFGLEPLELPQLRTLTIETCGMSQTRLRAVTEGVLPELHTLELWFGSENYGADVGVNQLAAILDGAAFRKVKHLGLRNAEFTDALCEALSAARILPQLKVLDLSMGTMSDQGALALARTPGAFAHLDALDVDDNFLTPNGLAALAALGCPIGSKRQKEEPTGDPGYRYVTAGE